MQTNLIKKNLNIFLIILLAILYYFYYTLSNRLVLIAFQLIGLLIWIISIKLYYKYSGNSFHVFHILMISGIGLGYYFSYYFMNWESDRGLSLAIGMIFVSLYFYGSLERFRFDHFNIDPESISDQQEKVTNFDTRVSLSPHVETKELDIDSLSPADQILYSDFRLQHKRRVNNVFIYLIGLTGSVIFVLSMIPYLILRDYYNLNPRLNLLIGVDAIILLFLVPMIYPYFVNRYKYSNEDWIKYINLLNDKKS